MAAEATTSAVTLNHVLPAQRIERNLRLHRLCEAGDLQGVSQLLATSTDADSVDTWYEDPACLNWSALHFAAEAGHSSIVSLLLRHGAIWNAVDANGYTAAQVAWSFNHEKCYRLIFEEGVRQTFLLNALEQQQQQHHESDDDRAKLDATTEGTTSTNEDGTAITLKPSAVDIANDTDAFLRTKLRFEKDSLGKARCLDQDNNMVMADWETDIMSLSAELICSNQPQGFSVLNVGFGLGIVDRLIQSYNPGRHVIIEAHPDAVAYAKQLGFHSMPNVEIFEGKWEDWIKDSDNQQDIDNMMALGQFDAVYWDTYSQDYSDIRKFFAFHGLAATNPFFYEVYTRISELDLKEIGLDTQWHSMQPEIKEEEWQGIKQKYWQLETYYCPLAQMDVFD
ncbi:hypothetical protein BCV70DRAFT_155592 [Testicularia cyperi]|uniref:RMT2 domain-containing protein n=1 Tax=Testicularia cyperi TaxID=1882483 RepID=A0A317Y1I0_9BASI|nr:hypothetical protein BCV70DRAFT_155592 [Testicularia cyperi]